MGRERNDMLLWIPMINPTHPVVEELIDQIGEEGYTYLSYLLRYRVEVGPFDLTEMIVSRQCRINGQKIKRIFPSLQKALHESLKILEESCKFFQESSNKVPRKFQESLDFQEESSKKVPTFDASNPRGSTRDLEENRVDKREENTPPNPLKGEASASPSPKPKTPSRKKIVPSDWQPPLTFRAWLSEKRPDVSEEELQAQIEKFKDYCQSNGKGYLDFEAALRNWFTSSMYAPVLKEKNKETEIYINPYCISNRVKPGHERIGGSGQW